MSRTGEPFVYALAYGEEHPTKIGSSYDPKGRAIAIAGLRGPHVLPPKVYQTWDCGHWAGDVERLMKKAGPQLAEVRHWNDAMKNRVSNDNAVIYGINSYRFEAWRKLGEIVADDLDALFALAREALERRRDHA